jgi:regulator of protease activity HflC (stomatin/prohibitin superfamily)
MDLVSDRVILDREFALRSLSLERNPMREAVQRLWPELEWIEDEDLREKVLDVSGQEIITSDKVSVRLNAVLTYRIENALKSIQVSEDPSQSLYRECQLILRSSVGARELDVLLSDKDALVDEIEALITVKAKDFGLSIVSFGIRDIILPGDMRDLMNKVVEARKVAEANFISRREETAATRSQCNTAKMLENSPTLMRLRELEVLERVASNSKLNLVLGDKGLADRITNLL